MTDHPLQIKQNKNKLRRKILKARRKLPLAEREALSDALAEKLFALPQWQNANRVGLYAHLPGEVMTDGIVEQAWTEGKQVALPKVIEEMAEDGQPIVALEWYHVRHADELEEGAYGVYEPETSLPLLDSASFDLILVPGVVFDHAGNRIGFGKGFYDRTLAGFNGFTVALAFACQIVDSVPVEPWDKKVQMIIESPSPPPPLPTLGEGRRY